jgi:hypothetical protein
MLLAPHGDKSRVHGWGPFFYSDGFFARGDVGMYWKRSIGYPATKIMIDMLALQTVFLAVLAAVLVNLRKRRPQQSDAGRPRAA